MRALGGTISGMRYIDADCAVKQITRIWLLPLLFQNGGSQSSRFLTAGQGEQSSGNKIAYPLDRGIHLWNKFTFIIKGP